MTNPTDQPDTREMVARLIDPVAFKGHTAMVAFCLRTGDDAETAKRYADDTHKPDMDRALDLADAIIAALRPPGASDVAEAVENPEGSPAYLSEKFRRICSATGSPIVSVAKDELLIAAIHLFALAAPQGDRAWRPTDDQIAEAIYHAICPKARFMMDYRVLVETGSQQLFVDAARAVQVLFATLPAPPSLGEPS